MTDQLFPSTRPAADITSVQSLGSGSSGNAFLIATGDTSILLDCGVGIRTITRALKERNLTVGGLDAVLVTHEHTDHIRTLSCAVDRNVPIVSTAGTRRRASIPPPLWEEITFARPLRIGTVTVWAIMVSHDAAEPCGYLIETADTRISIFTDLGTWHERLASPIAASDLVVLESNHDTEMLRTGPYPIHLKRRVASAVGHLSNADCATALAGTLAPDRSRPEIWLAHLSQTNNTPEMAAGTTVDALRECGLDLAVTALPRTAPGPVWMRRRMRDAESWAPTPRIPASLQLSFDTSG
jgi:phosphoribosyl 1,2-cyclic phosphodiesterase